MKFAGVGLVMLAAVCWGISGGIADILMTKGWDPIVISLYRGAVGFICFLAWLLFRFKQNWISSARLYIWSLLAGMPRGQVPWPYFKKSQGTCPPGSPQSCMVMPGHRFFSSAINSLFSFGEIFILPKAVVLLKISRASLDDSIL
jgi:EamA-like transporter family